MAEIDLSKFADALQSRLAQLGYSYSKAEEKWPAVERSMLSRAVNAKPLSAGNFLLICSMAGLDPFEFLIARKRRRVTMKSIVNQAVAAADKRETQEPEHGHR